MGNKPAAEARQAKVIQRKQDRDLLIPIYAIEI